MRRSTTNVDCSVISITSLGSLLHSFFQARVGAQTRARFDAVILFVTLHENEEKEIQEHTETEHPKRRKFQRTASLKVSKLLVHKREEYEERKMNRDLKRKRTEFNIPTKKSVQHKEREIDNSLSSSHKTEENQVTPTKALANSLRLLETIGLSSPTCVLPSDIHAANENPELPPITRHSRLSDAKNEVVKIKKSH